MDWKPIETAPKNGSHILLFRPEIQFTGYWGGANSGWRINAPGLPSLWPVPTHWMPLPLNPERPASAGEGGNMLDKMAVPFRSLQPDRGLRSYL